MGNQNSSYYDETLFASIEAKDLNEVKRLIEEEGVDCGAEPMNINTALVYGSLEIFKYLLEKGAKIEDIEGTPVYQAKYKNPEVFEFYEKNFESIYPIIIE